MQDIIITEEGFAAFIANKLANAKLWSSSDVSESEMMQKDVTIKTDYGTPKERATNVNDETTTNASTETSSTQSLDVIDATWSDLDVTQQPQLSLSQTPISQDLLSMCTRSESIISESDQDEEDSDDEDEFDEIVLTDLISKFSTIEDKMTLAKNGYRKLGIITDSLQGCVIDAEAISDDEDEEDVGYDYIAEDDDDNGLKKGKKRFAIKQTKKELLEQNISMECGHQIIVRENLLKEALILHHLTVDNKPTANYIAKYVDFFEDDNNYYLVTEFVGGTLADFCNEAHEYIRCGQLSVKDWKKIVKYLFWQLSALMYWLHNDMNCCHFDLTLENILVKNGNFILNTDNSVSIDPDIEISLIDFGLAELFKSDKEISKCNKYCPGNHDQYNSPKLFNEEFYNAKKSDIWSMGVVLFRLLTNEHPYHYQNTSTDLGFFSIVHDKLEEYLTMNNLSCFINSKILILLNGMLTFDQKNRFSAKNIIESNWFTTYYKKYIPRINKKSQSQKKSLKSAASKKKMKKFPFYNSKSCTNKIDIDNIISYMDTVLN